MASGGRPIKRAIGALKDSTTVRLAKVNSENKGIDVAIVKATNHDEVLPKEKHMMTLFNSLSAASPRGDMAYCIHALIKRLVKTHNWTVALKTLVIIHRALREIDPSFRYELMNYNGGKGLVLNLSHFRDESSPNAWDYSAWIRSYALYLEERLQCLRVLKYDVERDQSRTKYLNTRDLLEQLPAMQQLLFRLIDCKPEGAAAQNGLIHYALSIVAGESIRLYVSITDGIVNFVDKYFEMQRPDAIRALEVYKKAASQGEKLSEFFENCRIYESGQGRKLLKIQQPPASFVTAMEDYVNETPHVLPLPCGSPRQVPSPEGVLFIEYNRENDDEHDKTNLKESNKDQTEDPQVSVPDLLSFDEVIQDKATPGGPELEENNPLALALISPDNLLNNKCGVNSTSQNESWAVALGTTQTIDVLSAIPGRKMGGVLDRSMLDSLYEDAMARQMNPNGAYQLMGHTGPITCNPFDYDTNITKPHMTNNLQMQALAQELPLAVVVDNQSSNNPFGNPFIDQNAPSNTSTSTSTNSGSYSGLI